jgi:excisionase family DNA binding protein
MPKPDPSRELRTTAQACAQLGCSRGTIEKFWREGRLERVKFGGQTRITARSLDALVDELLVSNSLKPKNQKRR